jgi:hypothetical protein
VSGLATNLHSDDDFPLDAALSKVPERFSNLTQRVTSIYDRFHFAGLKKLNYQSQPLVWIRSHITHFLAAEQ